jgi:predicted nucleotidyltransferase
MMIKERDIVFTTAQAEGAWLNGTLVEKQNSEPDDGHPDGEKGKIVGSMGPLDDPVLGCKYGYFILWDRSPGVPVFTMETKLKKPVEKLKLHHAMLNAKGNVKFRGITQEATNQLLPDKGLMLLVYRGSIAHGMYVPQEDPDSIDDKDVMGVYIAPYQHYVGFHSDKDSMENIWKEWDVVCYELRKLIQLLLKGNPNVLSLLWVNDRHVIYENNFGKLLRANKQIFVSKNVYHSFNGYAYSQFKRMTHFKFEGYMGDKRKKLVEKFGYDTKNAAHLIRLLRMGIEFLTEGTLHVHRADAENLLAIKRGEWDLDKVKNEAERLFTLAEEAYVRSSLPAQPDRDAAEELLARLVCNYHGWDTTTILLTKRLIF